MSGGEFVATLAVEESSDFIACQQVFASEAFVSHFGRGAGGWWYDVRREEARLGASVVEESDAIVYKAWCAANVAQVSWQGKNKVSRAFVPATETVREVASLLARADRRDSVVEYLEGVRGRWDGVPRLDSEVPRAMGIVSDDDRARAERLWVRKWLVGAVARAMKPGCKMDTALLLVGPQGLGKSTSLQALFGESNVFDSALDFENKDGQVVMGRAWCVELAELASMRKAKDVEAVKHFLSLREDSYRPPYGRGTVTRPRRAVVAGTTNDPAPLTDPTGNRRFWPVRTLARCDLAWLLATREQVWAEALTALESGEPWHLSETESAAQAEVATEYVAQDEWVPLLAAWLEREGHRSTSVAEAAAQLGIEHDRLDRLTQMRIAACLRALGMERHKTERGWRWRQAERRED